jgi:hypothetical protein
MAKSVIVVGLVITLVGAGLGFWGVWVNEDQALEIGQARLSGDNRERDLQLPSVQNLIRQSRFAMTGFVLIGLGTALQIAGVAMTPSPIGSPMGHTPPPPTRPPTAAERNPGRAPRSRGKRAR